MGKQQLSIKSRKNPQLPPSRVEFILSAVVPKALGPGSDPE